MNASCLTRLNVLPDGPKGYCLLQLSREELCGGSEVGVTFRDHKDDGRFPFREIISEENGGPCQFQINSRVELCIFYWIMPCHSSRLVKTIAGRSLTRTIFFE